MATTEKKAPLNVPSLRKGVLQYLNDEDKKLDNPAALVDLKEMLSTKYADEEPREIRAVLHKINDDGVANLSGSWGSLGASYGGEVQGLKQVTIHGKLTSKGKEELSK